MHTRKRPMKPNKRQRQACRPFGSRFGTESVVSKNVTDAELAAVTAALRRVIEEDRFPCAQRLMRCGRRWRSSKRRRHRANRAPAGPGGVQGRQANASIIGGPERRLKPLA
jgi:hypothetical protein